MENLALVEATHCLCGRVSREGVPCGVQGSHPAGECRRDSAQGSHFCADCGSTPKEVATHGLVVRGLDLLQRSLDTELLPRRPTAQVLPRPSPPVVSSTHELPCGETKGGDEGVEAALAEAAVCVCHDRGCPAHSGRCRELAGPSGRCLSCQLLCACTRSGCAEHPNNVGGSLVGCANFAVGGGRRRCMTCIGLDRKRNDRRSCLCCCVSRGGVPCGAHSSHPAGECPGIATSGSQYCDACDAERRARRTRCRCRQLSCHLGTDVELQGQDEEEAEETRRAYGAPHEGHVRSLFPRKVDIFHTYSRTNGLVGEWRRNSPPHVRKGQGHQPYSRNPGYRVECSRFKSSPLNGGNSVYDEAEADALTLEYRNHCLSVSRSPKVRLYLELYQYCLLPVDRSKLLHVCVGSFALPYQPCHTPPF